MAVPQASNYAPPLAPGTPTPGGNHPLVKSPGAITFTPTHFNPVPVASALKGGVTAAAYSETITAQGGTPPYTFAMTSGALPTGTTLNSSSGVISGTPTAASTFSFTITVADSLGFMGSQAFSVIIAT